MNNLLTYLLLFPLLYSCENVTSKRNVKNNAVVKVLNGMDKPDSVKYSCDSCEKYIKTPEILTKIIEQATTETRESLKNPLSFIPRSIKMTVSPCDSFYYFSTNKHVDSCLMVDLEYKCIGKNAYGTENEVKSESIFFLVSDSIRKNFPQEIRKPPLVLTPTKIISRELHLYDTDNEGDFSILPIIRKPSTLIVTSSISCIDKDAKLYITFEDRSQISLSNWNDFNCKGTAYFNLTPSVIETMRTKKIVDISFFSDKHLFGVVPSNEADYFIQFANLAVKKME